ncbi:hypothetical protein EYZ11_002603 [Aspergillus tanneri]|nr:hypothetical protein EYZ11_002603 [Aspergillus tanneri]
MAGHMSSLRKACEEIRQANLGPVEVKTGFAMVSLVGDGAGTDASFIGMCCDAIAENGIYIEMTAMLASRLGLSLVVKDEELLAAMKVVYKCLGDL